MRNLSIYKLVLVLSAVLLLASCDTGYSGDIDPNSEVFNYKYPLTKGNVWEYLSTQRCTNFSNNSVAAIVGADTVIYKKLRYTCQDTTLFAGYLAFPVAVEVTEESHSADSIVNTYTKTTAYYRNNTSDYYLEYGRMTYQNNDSLQETYDTPPQFLKYNTYPGESWSQFDSTVVRKIDSFTDLHGQRVCLIKTTDWSSGDTIRFDEYYSRRGLEKKIQKFRMVCSDESGQEVGQFDITYSNELIQTNTK